MRTKYILLPFLALALVVSGCQEDNSLEGKKAKLAELETQLDEISGQIETLKAEIGAEDSTMTPDEVIPVEVGTTTLAKETFQHFVRVNGQVVTNNDVVIIPAASGIVTKVYVKEGQRVSRGQILAQIDDEPIRKGLEEAEKQLALATTVYQKQKNLWEQKIGSEVEYLSRKTQMEALEKSIEGLKAQLSNYKVRSPITGTLEEANLKTGQTASPAAVNPLAPPFRVVNLSDLKFSAELSEAYIPYVDKGDKVSLTFPTINETIKAKVSNISATIDPVNRTIDVEVPLKGIKLPLKANMIGELSINDKTSENALVVNQDYVQQSGSGDYLFVVRKSQNGGWIAKKQTIKTGMTYNGRVEVTEGLKAGDIIITTGLQNLVENQPVLYSKNS